MEDLAEIECRLWYKICKVIFLSGEAVREMKKRNHKFSNSPIHEFKVLHKGQSTVLSVSRYRSTLHI